MLLLPEKKLWIAVLTQAIEDLSHKNDLVREQAYIWFKQNKRILPFEICNIEGCDSQIGSFLWICIVLGLEADVVRKRLL